MNFINIARAGVISDATPISKVGTNVLFFLLSVFEIVAIISLVVAGITYFMAAGDQKRMQVAKRMTNFSIMGIVLALSGMIFVKFLESLLR
ncbi:MAG: hypothetical protein WCI36_04405 [bacterium]